MSSKANGNGRTRTATLHCSEHGRCSMGGYGSTRWRKHEPAKLVECAFAVRVRDVLPHAPSKSEGVYKFKLTCPITFANCKPAQYTYHGKLVVFRTAAGTIQRLFRCQCGRRIRAVYLPSPTHEFACRHCHHLVYVSAQRHNKAFDWWLALMRGDARTATRLHGRKGRWCPTPDL